MKNFNTVELNLTKEQTRAFIDWLANDDYWGHTLTNYETVWQEMPFTKFIINGHELWNYSNQHHQVIIDGGYCPTRYEIVALDGLEYSGLDYCLMKLGFEVQGRSRGR